jgi:anaerobic ribonucleoside-triphosphate reductase
LSRKAIYKLLSYEENLEELTDAIMFAQKVFLDFYLRGDMLMGGIPFSFPVVTINMVGIDKEILEMLNGEYSRTNFYLTKDDELSSTKFAMCCRYVLDSELMETLSGDANSFAATPFELGSSRVVTVNLPRCAMDANGDIDLYYELVEERVNKALLILKAHRNMLQEFVDKEILPLFKYQWMSMKRLFSTVGLIGTVEVEDIFSGHDDIINNTIDIINNRIFKASEEFGMPINVEQVPGEQARFNLAKKDKLVHGNNNYEFYSNQFVRLTDEVSFLHKIKTEGQYLDRLTGGGIAHLRMPGKLTLGQVTEVLNRSMVNGCNHLAISSVYSLCEENHSTLGDFNDCPVCGARIVDKFERIIGFFAPISRWSENSRRKDFEKRKTLN